MSRSGAPHDMRQSRAGTRYLGQDSHLDRLDHLLDRVEPEWVFVDERVLLLAIGIERAAFRVALPFRRFLYQLALRNPYT